MASYLPPTETLAIFDPSVFKDAGLEGLTYDEASKYFLKYPSAQGTENLQAINVNGVATFNTNTIVNNSTLDIDGVSGQIRYADNTVQTSAFTGAGASAGSYTSTNLTLDSNGRITAISSGSSGSGLVAVNYYTSSQTITPPANVYKFDIIVFGSGGKAGDVGIFGSYLVFGGAGAGGNAAKAESIPWTTGTMTLVVQPQTNGGLTSITLGSLGTAICYNGGNGSNGGSGGGGAGGVPSSTPNALPTSCANWFSYSGQMGSAGGSYSYPAGFPNPPNTTGGGITNTIYTAGMIGCGQSYSQSLDPIAQWNASPYTAGGCIITWYKTA